MTKLIKIVISLLPIKQWVILAIVSAFVGGGISGWKVKSVFVDSAEVRALKKSEAIRKRQEKENAYLEKKYLEERENIKVVYRDKIKQVVKYVDRDNCTVTSDGMQIINSALRGTNQ